MTPVYPNSWPLPMKYLKNFDACPSLETRGVFLDISKALDRVWHEGLLFKLKSYGITGPLLTLIKSFLSIIDYREWYLMVKCLTGKLF